jgi:hypothetical protein
MAQTILYGSRETEVAGATADGARLWVPLDDLERATGWDWQPQGLCQGSMCVPIPKERKTEWLDEPSRRLDFTAFAAHLGHSFARDEERGVWSAGPPARGGAASGTGPVAAPDFTLPDVDGQSHSLSDYRGKKVLLYCWASW